MCVLKGSTVQLRAVNRLGGRSGLEVVVQDGDIIYMGILRFTQQALYVMETEFIHLTGNIRCFMKDVG